MSIREARFTDTPAILEVLKRTYEKTKYKGIDEINDREARSIITQSIQRHGLDRAGGTLVLVAETDGLVTGLLIGFLDRVYHVGNKLMATDMFFICEDKTDPFDAYRMAKAFDLWANANPNVIEVRCATMDTVDADYEKAGRIWNRLGLEQCGAVYQKRITR